MRKEEFGVGDYVHVYNRGNRKMLIVYDEKDKQRFLKALRYFNNYFSPSNLFRELNFLIKTGQCRPFEWPKNWPSQKPLVKILAYCLMPNHFHLLLKEIIEGGISIFMKKLGDGLTGYINIKYHESGRLFQGSYKARKIGEDKFFQYLDAYIQVFNPFELYPGGIQAALKEFDKAFEFAMDYSFCSLGESFGERKRGIIDRDILEEIFPDLKTYKEFVYEALKVRNLRETLGELTLEEEVKKEV